MQWSMFHLPDGRNPNVTNMVESQHDRNNVMSRIRQNSNSNTLEQDLGLLFFTF